MSIERRIDRLEAILNETPTAKTRLRDVVDLKRVPTETLKELRGLLIHAKETGDVSEHLRSLYGECIAKYGKERTA